MRILLASSSSGSRGGGEIYLVALAQGLRGLGHEVALWMSDDSAMDELAEKAAAWADVIRSPYTNTYRRATRVLGAYLDRRSVARIAQEFRRLRPDIVHVNKQNIEDGLDLLQAARLSGAPAVATVHITRTMHALKARWAWLRDRLALRVLRRCEMPYLVVHPFDADINGDVRELEHGLQFHCVLNGVADALPLADRQAVRREWKLGEDVIVLGVAARIEHQKNPLYLLDILPQLPPRVHLVWVGDGRMREAMEASIAAKGLSHRVHIDGWRDDVPRRLSGMDIFVLPSLYEGLPLVVLEAMSAQLPLVASEVDGLRRAIRHGETGYLIDLDRPQDWVQRLTQLVQSPDAARQMGEAARADYLKRFSLEAMARATMEVYEELLSARQPIDATSPGR